MDHSLRLELIKHFAHGQHKVELNVPLDVINIGKVILENYANSPVSKETSTSLKFAQTHRDNYVELAGVILEIKGWLSSHPEPSEIRSMASKRLAELVVLYGQLLQTLIIIGEGMINIENVIEDDPRALPMAKIIAQDILGGVGEVGLFIS